jgi:hypothetical protein
MRTNTVQVERRRARSLHHRHAVLIHRTRGEVFHFLTHRVPEVYAELSPGHAHFRVLGGSPVRPHATIDCMERADNQVVHHHYQVRGFELDRHLYLASQPSQTWIHLKHRTIEDLADTHVYYDLSDASLGTLLDITIVIQLRSTLIKWLATITGGSRVWARHQRHEMGRLKALLERPADR